MWKSICPSLPLALTHSFDNNRSSGKKALGSEATAAPRVAKITRECSINGSNFSIKEKNTMTSGDLYIGESRDVKLYTKGSSIGMDKGVMLWTAA
jgi:hypothetical protein